MYITNYQKTKIDWKIYLFFLVLLFNSTSYGERLKDISEVAGIRANQLVGYGLVVGLDGTGDQTTQTPFTTQTFKNMMTQFGITMPEGITPQLKNVAAVSLHTELPPFAKLGQTLDITVSSIGNAKSLRGGSLLMTPMKGADGKIYAIAQGNLVVGGFGTEGQDGSKITVNVPSVGRVPNGATVEKIVPIPFLASKEIIFNLHHPDFTTAKRVSDAINTLLGTDLAIALDAASVQVSAPMQASERVTFLSVLENLEVKPAEISAKVIINSRTGTIVIGKNVTVSPAAITHGNLTVTIKEDFDVSQPQPFATGETVVTADSEIAVEEDMNRMFLFNPGATLADIVKAVNEVGAAPGDLMAILEALKQAGALRAELVVI